MRVRRVVLLLLLPVLAVAGLWQLFGGASGGNPAYTPPPPSVGVARITMREIEEHIEALGTTSSWESIEVRSTVTEFVEAIHFSDGQAVARNDPLLTLVRREEVAKLAEARAFLDELAATRQASSLQVALVGMRVDARTLAADKLREFIDALGVPVLGMLRNTQNYVHLAARGLTLFDIAPARVEKDLEQWQELCRWLDTP